jgi:transposase InsO family protein
MFSIVHRRLRQVGDIQETKEVVLIFNQEPINEQYNSYFEKLYFGPRRPGELLAQDTFYIGTLPGVDRVYLYAVVDTFSSFAFGFLHTSKVPEGAVAILHNEVLPFYREKNIPLGAVQTSNGREFCGQEMHLYELYLAFNDVEHRHIQSGLPQGNVPMENFKRLVLNEFFRTAFREKYYESVEMLQRDLDTWLRHYNWARPHLGCHNLGKTAFDLIEAYCKI